MHADPRYSQLVNLAKHAKGSGGMPQDPAAAGQYGRGQGYTPPPGQQQGPAQQKMPNGNYKYSSTYILLILKSCMVES